MTTWLLTWNPSRWKWNSRSEDLAKFQRHGYFEYRWSCGNTRRIRRGERFFLLKQGRNQPGLIGSGEIRSAPEPSKHWSGDRRVGWSVAVEFDVLTDEPLIPRDVLTKRADLQGGLWRTQASGVQVPERVAAVLERRWSELTRARQPRRGNEKRRNGSLDRRERPAEMILAGLFLSRFGERTSKSGATRPPKELRTASWRSAYAAFFRDLGAGRSLRAFTNSLKNVRDVFDGRFPSGRAGWRRAGAGRPPAALPSECQRVFDAWSTRSRSQTWKAVQRHVDVFATSGPESVLNDVDIDENSAFEGWIRTEGGRKVYISMRPERDPSVRAAALQIHGLACGACGFDFGQVYGRWGADFAEVHHRRPFGDGDRKRETDPRRDLVVICANCHRMVHRRRAVALTIEELQSKIDRKALQRWAAALASDST